MIWCESFENYSLRNHDIIAFGKLMQILYLPSSPVSLSMSSRVIGFSLDCAADMSSFERLTTPTTL